MQAEICRNSFLLKNGFRFSGRPFPGRQTVEKSGWKITPRHAIITKTVLLRGPDRGPFPATGKGTLYLGAHRLKRTTISALYADTAAFADRTATVCGWARSIRSSKKFGFIDLNDGSCFRGVQIVFEAGKIGNYKEVAGLNVGSALIVKGELKVTPGAKQPFEIHAAEITVEGASTPDYPLQKKRHSPEYLRTIAHLRPRTNLFGASFRVRSAAAT